MIHQAVQAETLAHCALAGIAHEPSAALAEELVGVAPPGLKHVFYTDNGSGSIEVAVKMALQMWQHLGAPKKTRFIALDGAYHGDTLGASSLSGVERTCEPSFCIAASAIIWSFARSNSRTQREQTA